MKVLEFVCVLFINLVILKSINGQTKNFVIGYCDSSNAALIYKDTVTIFNNKADEVGWFGRFWNWITFSSSESKVLKVKRIYPPSSSNYSNCNITCIRFADLIQNGTGGAAKISGGGIGKNYVELELTSQPNKGMFYSITLNGFCRSSIDQSITNGAVPNHDIGWKWNMSNNTNSTNQGGNYNLTSSSESKDGNNYTQTGHVNYGWQIPESNNNNSNNPQPGWVTPKNVSITPDNGWNKPANSSYGPSIWSNNNNNNRFAPIPPPLVLPSEGPPLPPLPPHTDVSSNGSPPNAPYGWNNNLYNSTERPRYIRWRNYQN